MTESFSQNSTKQKKKEKKEKKDWIVKFINYLNSFSGLSFIAVIALAVMIHHTSNVYLKYTPDPNSWAYIMLSYVFAFVVDMGIIVFVTRGLKKITFWFSFGQVVVNVIYYYFIVEVRAWDWIGAGLLSLALPTIIAVYSEQIEKELRSLTKAIDPEINKDYLDEIVSNYKNIDYKLEIIKNDIEDIRDEDAYNKTKIDKLSASVNNIVQTLLNFKQSSPEHSKVRYKITNDDKVD